MDITKTQEWRALEQSAGSRLPARALFAAEPDRVARLSVEAAGLYLDASKSAVSADAWSKLLRLAEKADLAGAVSRLFAGDAVNVTENRAALHMALRDLSDRRWRAKGVDVSPVVARERAKMQAFCANIHRGDWLGFTGESLDTVVNIGIGGSDLGPLMAVEALRPYWLPGRRTHFVSNVDGQHLAAA
ncbi:MAG: glucose-6-phosphate isomerase, partial [Parvularculaceae bacterium]|nr:glucose-6-phosphate isomerase [Parvularculaceae bacterium]